MSLTARHPPLALLFGGWALLLLFAMLLTLQDIRSNDYWWHLRAGQWIFENGAIPLADPFSYTANGSRWIDIHWLHQLLLYGTHRLAGHEGAVALKAVLVVGMLTLLAPIGASKRHAVVSWLALATLLVVASRRFMPRPELLSFVLLAAELALFDRFRRKPDRWIYGVVALQLIWVNLHGLFAVGLALCAIAVAAEFLHPIGQAAPRLRGDRLRPLLAVLLLSTLVSFANPNGLDGALYPLQQLGMISAERGVLGASNVELQPIFGAHIPLPTPYLLSLGLLVLGSAVAMGLNRRRLEAVDWLTWVAFGTLALGARRNAALFAIVAAPIWVRCWNEWRSAGPIRRPPHWLPSRWTVLSRVAPVAMIAVLGLLNLDLWRNTFYDRIGTIRERGFGVVETFTPVAAIEWIAANKPPGPLAHGLDSAGYLIWRLHPDVPVMIDGRLEVYGPERLLELWLRGPEQLAALDSQYDFGTALVLHGRAKNERLLRFLDRSLAWRLAYVDDLASIYVHANASAAAFPAIDTSDPALFPPLTGAAGPIDRQRRISRARFHHSLGHSETALALWTEALEHYPEIPHAQFRLAAMQLAAGRREQGVATLEALRRDPASAGSTLASAAQLLAAVGEVASAQVFRGEAEARGVKSAEQRVFNWVGEALPAPARAPLAALIGLGGAIGLLRRQRRLGAAEPVYTRSTRDR